MVKSEGVWLKVKVFDMGVGIEQWLKVKAVGMGVGDSPEWVKVKAFGMGVGGRGVGKSEGVWHGGRG